jgi:hypothetical protein
MTPFPEQPQGPWASRGVTRHEKQMLQFVVDVLDQPGGRELLLTEDGVRALRRQFGLHDVVFEPADTQRYKEKLFLAVSLFFSPFPSLFPLALVEMGRMTTMALPIMLANRYSTPRPSAT